MKKTFSKTKNKFVSSLLAFLIIFQIITGIFLPAGISTTPPYIKIQETYAAGWYNSSWQYRVKVTVLAAKVAADLTDYSVYVDLADLPAGFHTNVNQTDARDIRVTKSDGTTELPREVTVYDTATDTGELHMKYSGTLSSTVDTDIYIYYGNAAAVDYAATDTYGRNNVWNTNYKMVQHLKDTTASTITDSTVNANNGTKKAANEPIEATGQINKAQSFDGTDDYISVADAVSLDITDQITIEAWVDPSIDKWNYKMPITFENYTTPEAYYQVKVELTTVNFDYTHTKDGLAGDGDDLRFYETNGTKLDYWIEEWNATGNSTIWVEVATNNTGTIYMYYGNSGAGAESNGTNTFEFFDDFEGANIDSNKWNETDPNNYFTQNDKLICSDGPYNWNTHGIQSANTFSRPFIFETKWRAPIIGSVSGIGIKDSDVAFDYINYIYWIYNVGGGGIHYYHDGTLVNNSVGTYEANVDYYWRFVVNTTGAMIYRSTDKITWILMQDDSAYSSENNIKVGYSVNSGAFEADNALIRKYTSSEPTATVGNETAAGISKAGSYGIGANTAAAFASINGEAITGGTIGVGWNHIALTYNYLAEGVDEMKLYLNGAQVAVGDYATQITANANNLWIGDLIASAGITDEVRISATARSADWIATGYNNQSSPSTFYSVGGESATTFFIGGTETLTKDTAVTTITFPEGASGGTVDAPYNDLDGVDDPQVLGDGNSEPVVKIKNTGSASYNVVLEITTWTNSVVSMEYYNLATDGATNITAVTSALSNANGAARTVSTGMSIVAGTYKDLYLKLNLSSVAGKTGTSTLTILGETP